MSYCEDLSTLFPKYSMKSAMPEVEIIESSPSSKVKKVTLTNSSFQNIDPNIVKDLTSFFNIAKSSDTFKKNCDGIVMFEDNGRIYMFLCELKSTFDTKDIYYAKDQIISSYVKINMIMNMLRYYMKNNIIVKGLIFSLPHTDNVIRDISKMQMIPKFKQDACFTLRLCKTNKLLLKPEECSVLNSVPLGENALFNEIEFNLIDVNRETGSIELDVKQYI